MIVKDHIANSNVARPDDDIIIDCFETTLHLVRELDKLFPLLRPYSESDGDFQQFSDEQLLACDSFVSDKNIQSLRDYETFRFTTQLLVANRLTAAVSMYNQLMESLNSIVDAFVPLTESEIESTRNSVEFLAGYLTYFLYYEFDFYETHMSLFGGKEIVVNSVVYRYCMKHGIDCEQLLTEVQTLMKKHRVSTLSIEESADIHQKFYEELGEYAELVESMRVKLTEDDIISVFSGVIEPVRLVEILRDRE
jgi:hypothetical protein